MEIMVNIGEIRVSVQSLSEVGMPLRSFFSLKGEDDLILAKGP